jgi:hypothetical protein
MSKPRSTFDHVEHAAYLVDRTALDVRAAKRSPEALERRLVRRALIRALFKLFR